MLVVVQFVMMMMMMTSEAASAEVITVSPGESVLMPLGTQLTHSNISRDIRWTHPQLLLSLKSNKTTCNHGRCKLLSDGSLSFSRVQAEDAGKYTVQVFDQSGKQETQKGFLLKVEEKTQTHLAWLLFLLFLLPLFIILFILRKRTMTTDPMEENVYVFMHSHRSNKEEPAYVPCHPPISMETSVKEETPKEAEDIYV